MPDHAPATLRQRQEWREAMTFALADDELSFTARRGGSESTSRIPLADIDDLTWELPNASGRGWLFAGIFFFAAAAITLIAFVATDVPGHEPREFWDILGLAVVTLPPAAAAAFSFWTWRRLKRRVYIHLFNRLNGNMFCAIRADDPSPDEVARFVERVTADARRISLEGEEQAWTSASRLHAPREIRRFHDLVKEGVLTPGEFAAKKKALIEGFLAE